MKKIRLIYYLSICILVLGGIMFVRANRNKSTGSFIENLRDKTIIVYSSNFKRQYINSSGGSMSDIEKLGMESAGLLRGGGLDALFYRISDNGVDPYTASSAFLGSNLKTGGEYILLDMSRAQTKHGSKFTAGGNTCCPINIIISKKSKSFEKSMLFAGKIKYIIDNRYKELPVYITESDEGDYNQGMGYIGLLVEVGDAANTFNDAERTGKIFCSAVKDAVSESY